MLYDTIRKILGTSPHDRVKLRHYGETARPSIPLPTIKLTEEVQKGMDADVWIELTEDKGKRFFLLLARVELP